VSPLETPPAKLGKGGGVGGGEDQFSVRIFRSIKKKLYGETAVASVKGRVTDRNY